MRCPHCGDKIHDPGLDRFCPSCGKEIPHRSPEEKAIVRDRNASGILLLVSLILIMLGFSFVLPDVIIHWIDPEIQTMYWPYSLIVLIVGVLLLVIRHPFAKRSRKHTAVILEQVQAKWSCSYCGGDNVPGSVKCSSCGAPIKNK
jgi:hypothetical protein